MQSSSPVQAVYRPGDIADAERFAGILHRFYQDLLEQGVPDHLATLVRRLSGSPSGAASSRLALVVETDRNLRNLAAILLEQTGLDVVACVSADAAMSVLQSRGPDVVFVFVDEDLQGAQGGAEFARLAGRLWPKVRIVLTTGDIAAEAHGGLPDRVLTLRKPWSGLDVLIEAERALAAVEPLPGA